MVLPGKKYTPEDMVGIFWRRKWLVLVPFLVVFAGTVIVALFLPDRYRSETLMLVVPQRVPESYVRSTVTTRIEDRLRTIQQQILSRTKLEQIIRDFELYPDERARLPMEDVVEQMRGDVRVDIVRGDAFRVAYISHDPRKAMRVADALGQIFVNENEQDRVVLANATSDFLQTQLDEARRRLVEAEAKVAEFQRKNAGSLPSDNPSNLQLLHNLQLQVQELVDSAGRDRDRRLFLERSLADLESEAQDIRAAVPVSPGSDATAVLSGGTAAEQLEVARATLKALELRLKPEHPDVVYLRRVIRDLEAKVQSEGSLRPGVPAGVSTSPASRRAGAEETSGQRRAREIRDGITALDIQIASKQAEEKRLREQIAAVQGRVAATPGLAAEYTALTRDYDTLQASYTSLLAKYEDAKASAALESRQIGETFKVLDRARLPESPISPNRPLIGFIGAIAGLGLGIGLVVAREQMDRGLRSEDDVLNVLRLPVLAAIPLIETRLDRRRKRRRQVVGVVSTAVMVVVLAGATAFAWKTGYLRMPAWFW